MRFKRVFLDRGRIKDFAKLLRSVPKPQPLNFYSVSVGGKELVLDDAYPLVGEAGVFDFFFFTTVHNHGFWIDDGTRYVKPLYGEWEGKRVKGSDLLYKMVLRAFRDNPGHISPERLACISNRDHEKIFSDDYGPIPLFNTPRRMQLTRQYGEWFLHDDGSMLTPAGLVSDANQQHDPVRWLRSILAHPVTGIPAFREDPLQKKVELLIMSLVNRPERLLKTCSVNYGNPIVDYHDMRITLRLGHVVLPLVWQDENERRQLTNTRREWEIRRAVYEADAQLIASSGLTRDEVDVLKWSARKYCPEETKPECELCFARTVCARRINLFQPVFRTTFY